MLKPRIFIKMHASLLLLVASAYFVSASAATAASFDCSKAESKIERQICADPGLSILDDELAKVYREVLGRSPDPAALKKDQREWVREIRTSRESPEDIRGAYLARIEELRLPPGLLAAVRSYTEKKGDHERPRFRHALADLNGDDWVEAIVLLLGQNWCGSGGCTMLVFRGTKGGFSFVSGSTVTFEPIRVSQEKTHGWNNLFVYSKGKGDVLMRFDGKRYPLNPSMQPEAKPDQVSAAQVMIE